MPGSWQQTSEPSRSFYEATKIAEEIFPPSLPLYAEEILSSIIIHLIILCPASLSHYRLWFNPCNSRHYLILGLRSYLLFIRLLSSSVQPVVPLESSLSRLESSLSRLESSFPGLHLRPCHVPASTPRRLSRPPSIFHLSVAPVIYTLDKVVMPLMGRHLRSRSSSWLSWVCRVPFHSCLFPGVPCTLSSWFRSSLSGWTVYPILAVLWSLNDVLAKRLSLGDVLVKSHILSYRFLRCPSLAKTKFQFPFLSCCQL